MEIKQDYPAGKAAIFKGHGIAFELRSREVPALQPGEILVRTLYTTLCGSDIHTYCGRRQEPAEVVLGHEIVGEILAVDAAHAGVDERGIALAVGDLVTWSVFSVPPGIEAPRADIPQKSERLFKYGHALACGDDVFNGGLADYCILRSNTALVRLSRDMPLPVAATISCAHATVAGALRVAGEIRGKRVMVFGAGLLGLSCVSMCKEAGAEWVSVMDQDEARLAWAERFGANLAYGYPSEAGKLSWPEADIVFDMTGVPAVMLMGLDSLAIGGIAIWIGAVYPAEPVAVDAQKLVRRILQIRGLHNYNYEDLLAATAFIEANYRKYPFGELIEKEYTLDEIDEAFAYAHAARPVRVGIRMH